MREVEELAGPSEASAAVPEAEDSDIRLGEVKSDLSQAAFRKVRHHAGPLHRA